MPDPSYSEISDDDMRTAQITGAAVYLKAHVTIMARTMGVDIKEDEADAMTVALVEPLNFATEAMWGALMKDQQFVDQGLEKFKTSLVVLKETK